MIWDAKLPESDYVISFHPLYFKNEYEIKKRKNSTYWLIFKEYKNLVFYMTLTNFEQKKLIFKTIKSEAKNFGLRNKFV